MVTLLESGLVALFQIHGLEISRVLPLFWGAPTPPQILEGFVVPNAQAQGHGEWILKQNVQTHQHQAGADVTVIVMSQHQRTVRFDCFPDREAQEFCHPPMVPGQIPLTCICDWTQMALSVSRKRIPWCIDNWRK